MRVLLNINNHELNILSGDTSYYRNMMDLSDASIGFFLVGRRGSLRREARKFLEKCSNAWMPDIINENIFKCSRYIYVPPEDIENADVILSNVLFPFISSGLRRKIPVIWSIQGINPPHYYQATGNAGISQVVNMTNFFAEKAAVVLTWTESGAESLRKHCNFSTPVKVLPPIIKVASPKSKLKNETRLHLLFIGREPKRKGLLDVLKAFKKIRGHSDEMTLDIVSKLSVGMINALKVEPGINYFENVTDDIKSQLLDRADILILPTYAETYGYVLVEGMSHGCALITSDYMPLNDLVEDRKNGLLVRPGDVGGIENAISALINDSRLLNTLKENSAKKYMKEFAPDVLFPAYKDFFKSMLNT